MKHFQQPIGQRSATLTCYVQETSADLPNLAVCPAVLICPGGGYAYCSDREAEPVALAFLNAGYNAFVLRYTVSQGCPGSEVIGHAQAEAAEALTYIRDHAAEFHIDPEKVAALGFSAGANLVSALGTMGRVRPNALILGYGVYAARSEASGVHLPDVLSQIDANTPPSFLFATQGDKLGFTPQSLAFAAKLAALNIPYELHVFAYGDHGASLGTPNVTAPRCQPNPDVAGWFPMALRFLEHIFRKDDLVPQPEEVTEYGIEMNVGHLLDDPLSAPVIQKYLPELAAAAQQNPVCRALSLRKLQLFTQAFPEDRLAALVQALQDLNPIPF